MKVNAPNDIKTNPPTRRKKTTSASGGFSVETAPSASESARVVSTTPVAAVDSLLALQEVEDRDAAPFKRGSRTLDLLDDIRIGLLTGGIPASKLKALSQLISQERAQVADPQLSEILDEIDLRAQVELAKYGDGTA